MEENVCIESGDGFLVHGVLNTYHHSDKLIIFIHGLTGEKEYHLYYNGARFFPQHGYHTFRFDLFSNETKGRCLSQCTITTFSSDLSQVIHYFSSRYKHIYLIGHSIGGCIAMNAELNNVRSLILWDTGLYHSLPTKEPFQYNAALDCYLANLKIEYCLSNTFIKERREQDERVVKKVTRPMKLIFAGNTSIKTSWINRFKAIQVPFQQTVIPDAGHGFSEYGMSDILFNESLEWLQNEGQ